MKKITIYILAILGLVVTSCEDFVTEEPVDVITFDQVIIDAESAEAAILGVYSRLQTAQMFEISFTLTPGVLSDELTHSGSFPSIAALDLNNATSGNAAVDDAWEQTYTAIFQCNNVLELLEGDQTYPGLSVADQTVIIGEARFVRALSHFMLSNLHGAVPLATTTDLDVLSSISRTSQAEIYNFVITEAAQAATELASYNADETGLNFDTQFRSTQWAAKALGARANLYAGNVSAAGTLADDIITNGGFELAGSYSDLFGPGPIRDDEIIFGIFFSSVDQNDISFQLLPDGRFEYAVGPGLVAAYGENDARALIELNEADVQGRYYVNKYTDISTGTDGIPVFRLAEMHLIRAEANLGSPSADTDINLLRTRAGLPGVSGATLDDVLNERYVELAFEGHRWNDLVRTDKAFSVMSAINPDFTRDDHILPVPQRDIEQNPNLLPQNDGY